MKKITLNQHIKNVKLYLNKMTKEYPSNDDLYNFFRLNDSYAIIEFDKYKIEDLDYIFENMTPDTFAYIEPILIHGLKKQYYLNFKYYDGCYKELNDGTNAFDKLYFINKTVSTENIQKILDYYTKTSNDEFRTYINTAIINHKLESRYLEYLTSSDNTSMFNELLEKTSNEEIVKHIFHNQKYLHNSFELLLFSNKNISKEFKEMYIDNKFNIYKADKMLLLISNEEDMVKAIDEIYENMDIYLYEQDVYVKLDYLNINLIPFEKQKNIILNDLSQGNKLKDIIIEKTDSRELIKIILDSNDKYNIKTLLNNQMFKCINNNKTEINTINDGLIDILKHIFDNKLDEIVSDKKNKQLLPYLISYDYIDEKTGYLKEKIQLSVVNYLLKENEAIFPGGTNKTSTAIKNLIIKNSELFYQFILLDNDILSENYIQKILLLNNFIDNPIKFSKYKKYIDSLKDVEDLSKLTFEGVKPNLREIVKSYLDINYLHTKNENKNIYFNLRNHNLTFERFMEADKEVRDIVLKSSSSPNVKKYELMQKEYISLNEEDKKIFINFLKYADKIDDSIFQEILKKDNNSIYDFCLLHQDKLNEEQLKIMNQISENFYLINEFDF